MPHPRASIVLHPTRSVHIRCVAQNGGQEGELERVSEANECLTLAECKGSNSRKAISGRWQHTFRREGPIIPCHSLQVCKHPLLRCSNETTHSRNVNFLLIALYLFTMPSISLSLFATLLPVDVSVIRYVRLPSISSFIVISPAA